MKICVLQVSYENSTCEYQYDDMARDLSPLLPGDVCHHEFLKKTSTFQQLRRLKKEGYDIYVNLCEGFLDTDLPSIDVVWSLERLNLPYTGPNLSLYAPPKDLMKRVAEAEGVSCPPGAVVETAGEARAASAGLRFPLFVKPNEWGDSFGIDQESLVPDAGALERKIPWVVDQYGPALVEEYIPGREFTVLLCAGPEPTAPPLALLPLEYCFPAGERFKTYDLKIRQYHPECHAPCRDEVLAERLKDAACRIFTAFSGESYARLDFRLDESGKLFFLDANFGCSIFYPEGFFGSADFICQYDGIGQAGFLRHVIAEGLARHARKQKTYIVRRTAEGYGIVAARRLSAGEVVLPGEERSRRLVTRGHVEKTWNPADQEIFSRYAYPVGPDTYVIWGRDPAVWAPQNHACDPNTGFRGLDVVALRDITPGEELTIDYGTFYDARLTPFDCRCSSPACRGRILGSADLFRKNNSAAGCAPVPGFLHDALEMRKTGRDSHSLFATRDLSAGAELFSMAALPRVSLRTRYSIQLEETSHLDRHPQGSMDDYLNHGCRPNARFDPENLIVCALRRIRPGEEVRINYCATEEELAAPFACDCGSPDCYGRVAGFRFLDRARQVELSPLVSPWLKAKYGL